ncbi:hypothetical protein F4779DRAFT_599319 [Xylariaceae sp. FL0662B]|nr:hypothetical protein F4779DRAFT_599319 [Xylariaceae sp. FL0662B]
MTLRRNITRLVANHLPTTTAYPRPVLLAGGSRSALRRYEYFTVRSSSIASYNSFLEPCPTTMSSTAPPTQPSKSTAPSAAAPSSDKATPPPPTSAKEANLPQQEATLPALTPAEFHGYNRLAEHMDLFHAHFRRRWNLLWGACAARQRPARLSLRSFLEEGLGFLSQLETHHTIEETYIFPVLARRMPEFRTGGGGGGSELLRQHREIHRGMEAMETYLRRCRAGESDLDFAVLQANMESWGPVLWRHLDQEVETLGAENMRKYWTIDEISRIPM